MTLGQSTRGTLDTCYTGGHADHTRQNPASTRTHTDTKLSSELLTTSRTSDTPPTSHLSHLKTSSPKISAHTSSSTNCNQLTSTKINELKFPFLHTDAPSILSHHKNYCHNLYKSLAVAFAQFLGKSDTKKVKEFSHEYHLKS